jgi:hypothetical protein
VRLIVILLVGACSSQPPVHVTAPAPASRIEWVDGNPVLSGEQTAHELWMKHVRSVNDGYWAEFNRELQLSDTKRLVGGVPSDDLPRWKNAD